MRRSLVRISWAGLLVLIFTSLLAPPALRAQDAASANAEAIELEIRAVMAEMRKAAAGLDAEVLYEYVLESATPPIIEDGRLAPTRSEALEATRQGMVNLDSLAYTYTRESITVLSPETVLWVGAGSAAARLSDGRRISAPFAETILLVRREEGWRVLHAHRSAPDR